MTAVPGWDDGWEFVRRAVDPQQRHVVVRIAAAHRGAYHATSGEATAMVELRGRHYHAAADRRELPAVGDFCLVSGWQAAQDGAGSAIVEAVLERRSLLVRRSAGSTSAPQPMAANVDVALLVTAAGADLVLERIDRYLELVRGSGIAPVVVVSKIDLATEAEALIARVRAHVPEVPVLATSAADGRGLAEIGALIGPGQTAIVLGSSGVGKSSLLSAVLGSALASAPVRAHDERGRHTTTVRQLHVAPDGSLWIDTPGMRELAAYGENEVEQAFTEVTALGASCRFADCLHRAEPGCAVTAAIAAGQLEARKLTSYHKLVAERAADRRRVAAAARPAGARGRRLPRR